MYYDKIKIYVTARIAEILLKDAEQFEFFKKDGRTPNKNALLTKLIVNYSDEFREKENELFSYLQKTIGAQARISNTALKSLCFDISEHVNDLSASPNGEKFDKLISLKPTKESQPIIDYIEAYALEGVSLSEYFRNMFASYAALPQDRREGIIFKDQRDALAQAIKAHKKVFLSVAHDKKTAMEFSPYALTATKEELHSYLIGSDGSRCVPLRLSRLLSVTVLREEAIFSAMETAILERMLLHGPQFIYSPYEEEIRVELTEKGMEKFKKIYLHRPTPVDIQGNLFVFRCSYTQAVQYFSRLGSDAYVLSPKRVRDDVQNFYRRGYYAYKDRQKHPDDGE